MKSPSSCTFVSLTVSLVILINLTGQLCQLVDSPLIMESSGSQSSSSSSSSSVSSSSDSELEVGDLSSSPSSSPSIDPSYDDGESGSHESKKKRYQQSRYLVRPFWLNPKYTWKAFQVNASRNEAKEEEVRKLRDKKRSKLRKLAERVKKASLIAKKLFLLLNEISSNFDPELV